MPALVPLLCATEQIATSGRNSWLQGVLYEDWPLWEKYVRAFDRALLIALADGNHGSTGVEVALSCVGLLWGVVALAYFTSTMVSLVTSLNQVNMVASWLSPCPMNAELPTS